MPATHGGPAYPTSKSQRGGLTFRDACAIAFIGALDYDVEAMLADGARFDAAATAAYRMADEMMRARRGGAS